MIVDAVQLLRERQIIHPSRIVSSSLADREFLLTLTGYPWWRETREDEGRISFRFSGVSRGELDLAALCDCGESEWLEDFSINLTSTLDWASPNQFQIFCSAPLPNPLAVYAIVENYIFASGAYRTPGDYLNGAVRLNQFLEFTGSSGYLLVSGPETIRDLIVAEIEAQSVRHTVTEAKGHHEAELFVRLEGSAFFCATAVAEFD